MLSEGKENDYFYEGGYAWSDDEGSGRFTRSDNPRRGFYSIFEFKDGKIDHAYGMKLGSIKSSTAPNSVNLIKSDTTIVPDVSSVSSVAVFSNTQADNEVPSSYKNRHGKVQVNMSASDLRSAIGSPTYTASCNSASITPLSNSYSVGIDSRFTKDYPKYTSPEDDTLQISDL